MPITTTSKDVIFVGHGYYKGGAATFLLPDNVELWLIQTANSALTDGPVIELVSNYDIDRLMLRYNDSSFQDLAAMGIPLKYRQTAPNLVLQNLDEEKSKIQNAISQGVIKMVDSDTSLQQLLQLENIKELIAEHRSKGTYLRVFWAACAVQDGNSEYPTVFSNAMAIAFAATNYVQKNRDHIDGKLIDQASKVVDFAKDNPHDTEGALKCLEPEFQGEINRLLQRL